MNSKMRNFFKIILYLIAFILLLYIVVPKPEILRKYSFSSAVYDTNTKLLKLGLTLDDKYRLFVPIGEVPKDLQNAIILYEDRSFYYHFGFNPFSIIRAGFSMIAGGRTKGASTITMQLARIIYNIDSTKISGKIAQILRAIQIEMFYSKEQILEGYFNLAPYSGNVEGIGSASIIYFDTRAQNLNLQQSMALAVIPQNPNKRNLSKANGIKEVENATKRLKQAWFEKYGKSDEAILNLPLKAKKYLPNYAPHFVRYLQNKNYGEVFSTLDLNYQKMLEEIVENYLSLNKKKGANNASAIIINHKTMEVVAYVGSRNFFDEKIQGQVDGLKAYRSPGSTLKPFIYAQALDEGIIHPLSILKDIPKNYSFYTPENFDKSFMGLISATNALIYSRNIPVLDLLSQIKKDSFYNFLQETSVKKLKTPEYYGLGLALGAFELSAIDIATQYASLANLGQFCPARFDKKEKACEPKRVFSKEGAFLTLHMLSKNSEIDRFESLYSKINKKYSIAWKTGTSFGFRDAWTAGVAGDYVVVVWVGNFDGTSNNNFLGRKMAAPLFFKIIRAIAKNNVMKDVDSTGLNLAKVDICKVTGDIDNGYCKQTIKSYFIPGVSSIKMSNVTRMIPVEVKTGLRACRHTPPTTRLEYHNFWTSNIIKSFQMAGIGLKSPPKFAQDCDNIDILGKGKAPIINYPTNDSVYIVRSKNLEEEKIVLKATLDSDANKLYWYVNNKLVGEGFAEQSLDINVNVGTMEIMAVDNLGRASKVIVTIKLVD